MSLPPAQDGSAPPAALLSLLGGFELTVQDEPVPVSGGSARLLAFVAMRCRAAVPRALVAQTLWPAVPERCAYANLRSALSRLPRASRDALDVRPDEIHLARHVSVDLHRARRTAYRALDPAVAVHDLGLDPETMKDLSTDLLPGWYDDWVLLEADHWRQLRLGALEAVAVGLIEVGRFAEAQVAALTAVRDDPLRETGHSILIRAHLAAGNRGEALRDLDRYERYLHNDLGLEPTPELRRLVAELMRAVTPR
ncbi:bacterial transcriptional activator domain-containing protein [Catellatospora citrea]|uniref:AfsR/SARP family transcriptional regulator n=1 Tax=Catellatospora citrea TaxID=53366 RepID=UPI0034056294